MKIIFTNIIIQRIKLYTIIHAACKKIFVQFDLQENYFMQKTLHKNLLEEKVNYGTLGTIHLNISMLRTGEDTGD